ncbi:hypothetical protein L1987_27842 [Smallanthus sonchifolius]|uniref:Uncharacterized protein n=1 Tax=Smallanthus sonchifolius TaxID=185202 RepID=A0ACB9IB08_9ASTR|nr:hypothetical protein L1987_27842 [Smallanthus sonchifolius]
MSSKQDSEARAENAETETNKLRQLIEDEDWFGVYTELKERDALKEKINSDGNTLLHIAVGIRYNYLIESILPYERDYELTEIKNKDGSTVLHIAAIVGNTYAAEFLVKKNRNLLNIQDKEGHTPLDKAYENGHLNTVAYLQEAAKKRALQQLIVDADWDEILLELKERNALTEKINSNGDTLLHIAVGISRNYLISTILGNISYNELTEMKNWDGSTVLHIAAIVGNIEAAELLVNKNETLLHILDNKGQTPLDKAYENMHLDTIAYLLEAAENNEKHKKERQKADVIERRSTLLPSVEIGVDLLVNAISAKRYDFASKLIIRNPEYAVSNDNVLMAFARTFPSGLDYRERLIYPSLDNMSEIIVKRSKRFFGFLVEISSGVLIESMRPIIVGPVAMVYWIFYHLIPLLLLMVYFPFFMLYLLLWKATTRVVPPVKNIEQKKKEYKEAKKVLQLVLETIIEKRPESSRALYTRPILEAACQDAYEVVDQILGRWPEAIRCKDKNGYDIIQLATIHRSERIYNFIYIIGERKSIYRTIEDSCKNNMLHLAGRLAPSNKLKRRTGAALQLQRELQWRQEVEKLVFPTYVTRENVFTETPEMVFTKEHENLVKEGEKWIKTVSESCSITAALITTIVFAAAITVPGGSNQETGIPVFTKQFAFTIFAIADAISLFSSATALLVFLSILTARFAEHDFLIRLPRRLIIGLCTLFISTTSMMVAFSATLFLVFSHQKQWVLAPICSLAFLPIAFFFVLQFPLILDLLQSTYIFKFGKSDNKSSKLYQNNIRFIFSK